MNRNKIGILSKADEQKLFKKIASGKKAESEKAKKELLHMGRFLVGRIAGKYSNNKISFIDVYKAGERGLVKALENYLEKGRFEETYRFSTYSTYFIREAIVKKLSDDK